MENVFEEYAVLQAEIDALESRKEQLRPTILKTMVENGLKKMETSVGNFTASKLKSWSYPQAVLDLGENFKAAKAKAESTGEATYEEKDSLRFTKATL